MSDKSKLELLQTSATPQSLKDNESIQKLMDLYFSNLKDQQELSEEPLKLLDTDYLISRSSTLGSDKTGVKFDNVKRELFKIHLNEIHKIFESIADSESIYKRYKEIYQTLNFGTDNLKIDFNLDNEINDNYITASNSFKSKKGTKAGFFFVNDIINKVNIDPLNSDKFFQIDEDYDGDTSVPFSYTVKASLYKEVFKETILPLSHPVGFNWHFLRLLYLTLTDYFGLIETKTITDLILTCHSLTDESDISRQVLLKSRTNTDTGEKEITGGIFGSAKNFFVSEDQDQRGKVVVDFYAKSPYPESDKTQDGLRLIRDYNGHVVIYTRQRQELYTHELTGEKEIIELELDKIQLTNKSQGELTIFKKKKIILGKEVEVIDSVRFKEYSIFNLNKVQIKYSFVGGTPLKQGEELTDDNRQWAYATIKLDNKVMSKEKKFFESVDFTKEEIIDNTGDYNGRIVEDRGTNCSIQYDIDYKYKVTTSDITGYVTEIRKNNGKKDTEENTVEEFDTKETFDHWARLDPNNGVIEIGENIISGYGEELGIFEIGKFPISGNTPINKMDRGINTKMGPDSLEGDTVLDTDYRGIPLKIGNIVDNRVQRNEAYFRPTAYRNLQTLTEGSNVNGHQLFEVTNTPEIYERENKENSIYYAHEDRTTDETILMTAGETAIDLIYSDNQKMPSNYYFDEDHELVTIYKGKTFKGYSIIGGRVQGDGGYSTKDINDFVIGGFKDHNTSIEVCTDPEVAIYRNKTTINADPVNLLLNTYDCNTNDFIYSNDDNVNRKGDFKNNGSTERFKTNEDSEESFVDEQNTTDITYAPYTDDYNYEQHDWYLHGLTIGDFHIKGKPRPILDNSHIVNGKRINATTEFIKMNSINTLEYNNFTNMTDPIGSFTINDNSEIGGHIYSQDTQAEIYQTVWNTHEWDSDNIDEFVYAYEGDFDNVGKKGDFKNDSKDLNYKIQNSGKEDDDGNDIYEEVFAEENTNDFQAKEFEDLYNFRNYGKEINDFTIDSNEFIGGELHNIDDNSHTDINNIIINSTTIKFIPFKNEKYVYNTFNNTLEETSNIGAGIYIGGELHKEEVNADVYKGEWNSNTHDDDTIDQINEEKRINEHVVNGTQYTDETNNVTENVFAQEKSETKDTYKPAYDNYNLRNADGLIGANMIIGGSMTGDAEPEDNNTFYVGGELREIQDRLDNMDISTMGGNSYTELVVASPLVIGEGEIGKTYIKARLVEWSGKDEESFMNVGQFDIFSDEDNWDIGVYKNVDGTYVLLEDNNVSALS